MERAEPEMVMELRCRRSSSSLDKCEKKRNRSSLLKWKFACARETFRGGDMDKVRSSH